MNLLINPLWAERLWCMTFAKIFLAIMRKLMRTAHVRQGESRAFIPVLLSLSRCDSLVLSPNDFFYYHFKLIRFQIREQSNTNKRLPEFHLLFIFLGTRKLPVGGKTVTAGSAYSWRHTADGGIFVLRRNLNIVKFWRELNQTVLNIANPLTNPIYRTPTTSVIVYLPPQPPCQFIIYYSTHVQ